MDRMQRFLKQISLELKLTDWNIWAPDFSHYSNILVSNIRSGRLKLCNDKYLVTDSSKFIESFVGKFKCLLQ